MTKLMLMKNLSVNSLSEHNLSLTFVPQGTNVEHSKMMCHVQTLVLCSRSQAMIDIFYQNIVISPEISDYHIKTIRHICSRSRSQATFQLKIHSHGKTENVCTMHKFYAAGTWLAGFM